MAKRKKYMGTTQRFWDFAVTFSIFALFMLVVMEFLVQMTDDQLIMVEVASLIAIGILATDLYKKYRVAKDKMKFLAKNWIAIIALLPLGTIFRMGRFFESVRIFESVELLGFSRAARVLPRLEELVVAIPGVRVIAESKIVSGAVLKGHDVLSSLSSVTDFLGEVVKLAQQFARSS